MKALLFSCLHSLRGAVLAGMDQWEQGQHKFRLGCAANTEQVFKLLLCDVTTEVLVK